VQSSAHATFAALLEELGPSNRGLNDAPMPLVLEAFPGGRWFRDLGDGEGHFWGVVQAIRKDALLEITGPMMMSFAVAQNVQYRLTPQTGGTLLTMRQSAIGLFPDGFRENFTTGWAKISERAKARAEGGR
jgi:hypothetical protein